MLVHCLFAALLAAAPDKPACVNINGQTVCGFNCKAENGTAKCAQTPAGICTSNDGKILCFDPPKILSTVLKEIPKPECKVSGGAVACGYNCTSSSKGPACNTTPAGICEARYGFAVCFDPPDEVFGVWGKDVPAPKCLSQDGHIGCGYNCVGTSGSVACAKTPVGVCLARDSAARCFDPPSGVLCALGADIKRPSCVFESGQIFCGYDCKSTSGRTACAQTPRGTCTDGAGGITCFDPPIDPGEATACLRSH